MTAPSDGGGDWLRDAIMESRRSGKPLSSDAVEALAQHYIAQIGETVPERPEPELPNATAVYERRATGDTNPDHRPASRHAQTYRDFVRAYVMSEPKQWLGISAVASLTRDNDRTVREHKDRGNPSAEMLRMVRAMSQQERDGLLLYFHGLFRSEVKRIVCK